MPDLLQLSPAAKRWIEITADFDLAQRLEKIETDALGQVIISPPSDFIPRIQAAKIRDLLNRFFGEARAILEQAVDVGGSAVKVPDMAWLTHHQYRRLLSQPNLPITPAPPICVEVISPKNTSAEFDKKRRLYFAAGAEEVWVCDRKHRIRFFGPGKELSESILAPGFPKKVVIEDMREDASG